MRRRRDFGGSSSSAPPQNNPVPSISSLSPASATVGGAAFTLTVNGSGFISTSTVQWNGSNLVTTYVSATQLTASVMATDIATVGNASVTVANPTPGGGPSTATLWPSETIAGSAAFTLTVNGDNFISGATVQWNGSNRTTTYVNASQLTASISAADIAAAGTANITIVNPAPSGGPSTAVSFGINNLAATGSLFKGILMETYTGAGYDGLEYQTLLNNAVDTNANYVGIGGVAAVDLNTGVISDAVVQGYDLSVPMSSISAAVAAAEAKGLNVVLKPIVGAINSSTGQFASLNSANLAPGQTLADPATFFANLKTYMLQWAQIGQQYNASLLVLGTEMELATQPQFASYWTDIIASVRQVYSGKLTYAAVSFIYGSTYNEVGNIQFWNQLDYVGVNAYPQVSTGLTTPTVAQIDAAWASEGWKQALGNIAAATGKPIIFTESGVASYLGALDPTYSGYGQGSDEGTQDFATQTNWFQSFVDTWTGPNQPSWFQGVLFWDNDPATVGTIFSAGFLGFDFAEKPANAVVASMFGGIDYLSSLQSTFAGSAENDQIALYGDSVSAGSGGTSPASRQQTYQTTVSLYIDGTIMNGATPTVHVYINGGDYGAHTLANTPGGYVGSNGVPYTNIQRFDFAVNGITTISSLQVNFDSAVNVGGPENSQLEFQEINIDGIPITQATYSPLAQYGGGTQQQILPPSEGGGQQDTAVQDSGGYTVFDATPYNQRLTNLPGSAANPITVTGNGGTDTVHVLGTASQYTESGIGTNTVTLTESSGLNQNARLTGISYVSFWDGSVLSLATGQLQTK